MVVTVVQLETGRVVREGITGGLGVGVGVSIEVMDVVVSGKKTVELLSLVVREVSPSPTLSKAVEVSPGTPLPSVAVLSDPSGEPNEVTTEEAGQSST